MTTPVCDTLIMSDLHLGSELSRARDAVKLLKRESFRRLILLGDIFADLNFGRLKKDHWQFLSTIRKLSNPKRGIEVVWVEGNHDRGLAEMMAHLMGVRVYHEYKWDYAGLKHLAVHGHQFDGFVVNNVAITNVGQWIYLAIQKLEPSRKHFSMLLDRLNTAWLRLSPKVCAGALAHARLRNVQRVFCGHTHHAMNETKNGIAYFNSGCWTTDIPTYITIDEEGVHIHEYIQRSDDRDPGEERGTVAADPADLLGEAGLPGDAEYEDIYS